MKKLEKTPTGIGGLDEILHGGLPRARPTLLLGGPGCGKTALAMEFVCRGARQFNEPGLFVSFEETPEDIKTNFMTCGFGFKEALGQHSVHIQSVLIARDHTVEAGEFTLDGLLVRFEHALKESGACRLVLDSINSLTPRFSNTSNLRYEFSRIFSWIKEKGITAIVTSEREDRQLHRYGIDEYLSDCVIHMDHRIKNQISKRRLRVVKFRGSSHGMDEYPFLIRSEGISVLPITSLDLDSAAPHEFVSTGIDGLDKMLDGKGYYRGSALLISGGAGTGKTTVAASFARITCHNNRRSLYLTFEESANQIVRNLHSVGIDLEAYIKRGLMRIEPIRPSTVGLEEHLVRVHTIIEEFEPDTVVLDPITSFTPIGSATEIGAMLTRLLDYMKEKGINSILTSLTPGMGSDEETDTGVSSVADTWIIINFLRTEMGRQRQIYVHKARGIAHSQTIGELVFSGSGPLVKPSIGNAEAMGDA
jgi:circadian clock protein KaiC